MPSARHGGQNPVVHLMYLDLAQQWRKLEPVFRRRRDCLETLTSNNSCREPLNQLCCSLFQINTLALLRVSDASCQEQARPQTTKDQYRR